MAPYGQKSADPAERGSEQQPAENVSAAKGLEKELSDVEFDQIVGADVEELQPKADDAPCRQTAAQALQRAVVKEGAACRNLAFTILASARPPTVVLCNVRVSRQYSYCQFNTQICARKNSYSTGWFFGGVRK